ncbi:uncharacterized protein LOC131642258 [Vicia villosa]|uniref:uncharacterized protein LOC131642258 n=1 Tax=Vicia villosa TaxID=3911 RepID=UPI00273A975A|nr:uncharacterized protein LOC131642258 [Vicia villosa]
MTVDASQKEAEATGPGIHFIPQSPDDTVHGEKAPGEELNQRLDAIYDEEPLGFEKDPMAPNIKMLAQDPLEEVNLGDKNQKRVTYISAKLDPALKSEVIALLKENKDLVENPQQYVELKPWKLYFDGSTYKEGSGVGMLIISPNGIPTKLKYKIEGPLCSNNEAEYEALITGLEALLELVATRVEIKGDSELVIKQLTKEYKCIKENLIMYFVIANRLFKKFEYVELKHVPRINNQEANDLAQLASGYRVSKGKLEELAKQ